MGRGPSPEKTEQTRQRILRAAEVLLSEQGYAGWGMRELAERSGCATGLLYRYFPTRGALVLALYRELASELRAQADELSEGTAGARFAELVSWKLQRLEARRGVFASLAHVALAPDEEASVLGAATASLRQTGIESFTEVVAKASFVPAEPAVFGRLFYLLHLLIVLAWTQNQRGSQARLAATSQYATELGELLDLAVGASALPALAALLHRIDKTITAVLEPSS
jgi:AcrR family transcriptional regulator